MLAGQGLFIATSVATVEELLFRSWLPKEIAVDLGHHQGIIISGLAFSLCQRYILDMPNDILLPSIIWFLLFSFASACVSCLV